MITPLHSILRDIPSFCVLGRFCLGIAVLRAHKFGVGKNDYGYVLEDGRQALVLACGFCIFRCVSYSYPFLQLKIDACCIVVSHPFMIW